MIVVVVVIIIDIIIVVVVITASIVIMTYCSYFIKMTCSLCSHLGRVDPMVLVIRQASPKDKP